MTMTSTTVPVRAHNGMVDDEHDDGVDPAAKATRRRFTREFKQRIVDEYDVVDREERGAVLRREGLYTSHISEWRNQLARTEQPASSRRRRSAEQAELERLRKRNARLETELERTRLALEITGKAHALLEMLSESADIDPKFKQ
jgi:transposase-like protein